MRTRHTSRPGKLAAATIALSLLCLAPELARGHSRSEQRALLLHRGEGNTLSLTVDYQLLPGALATRLWSMIDMNRNGRVDGKWEKFMRARVLMPRLLKGVGVRDDGAAPTLRLVELTLDDRANEGARVGFRGTARFVIDVDERPERTTLTFVRSGGEEGAVTVRVSGAPASVVPLEPGGAVELPVPASNGAAGAARVTSPDGSRR